MQSTSSNWPIVTAVAFIVAAIGIVVQWKSGVSNAKVPVGAIILTVAAVITALRIWRWTPVAGAIFCMFILIVAFIIGGVLSRLTHPHDFGPFIGTVLQMAGLIAAIVTGILTAICNVKKI